MSAEREVSNSSTMPGSKADPDEWTKMSKQLSASVFFGIASISIITVNKAVLTTFQYVLPINAHHVPFRHNHTI